MKVFLAVFICKILYFLGKCVGKGSSLPGKVVLKIFPDVLGQLSLPETIIAVTGSNGKTSVTEIIVHALKSTGRTVAWNHEGSNQTEGVATVLLRSASFGGKVKSEAVVMECDERYAKNIFTKVKPTVLLVTNLCRDQLTRNGHPEFVEDCLRAAIGVLGDEVQLVLNADDPYVSALAYQQSHESGQLCRENRPPGTVLWFGVKNPGGITQKPGMYDDGAFCPVCKARMSYSYRVAGHYGDYSCSSCGLKRNKADVEAIYHGDQGESSHGSVSFNDDVSLSMKQPSITGAYNFCAAVAVCKAVGINISDSAKLLDGYELTGGRTVRLKIGERDGLLLISKHENSFAYDCSLSWITGQKKQCTVIVLVDSISRKYYTSETSWLWDIDFDLLSDECVKNVVLAGRYVNELAARFDMSGVLQDRIGYVADLSGLRKYIEENTVGEVYVVTCFSDKKKLLKVIK